MAISGSPLLVRSTAGKAGASALSSARGALSSGSAVNSSAAPISSRAVWIGASGSAGMVLPPAAASAKLASDCAAARRARAVSGATFQSVAESCPASAVKETSTPTPSAHGASVASAQVGTTRETRRDLERGRITPYRQGKRDISHHRLSEPLPGSVSKRARMGQSVAYSPIRCRTSWAC